MIIPLLTIINHETGRLLQLLVVRFQRHHAFQVVGAGRLPEDRALQRSDSSGDLSKK